jgi:hypothetical protein
MLKSNIGFSLRCKSATMGFYKSLVFLITILLYDGALAQTKPEYEVVYFGPYKEVLSLNKNKNWYLVAKAKDEFRQEMKQIVKIDPVKDLRWGWDKKDSTYLLKLGGAVRKREGEYLIGTYDTLREIKYSVKGWGVHAENSSFCPLKIGYVQDVNMQGFRDTSPYIELCITGTSVVDYYSTTVVDFNMTAVCVFDDIAYYDIVSFGGKDFKNDSNFHQSLNLLIEEYLHKEGVDSVPPIRDAYLMQSGYIDRDGLVDFIITISGRHYLLLTYNHDLDNRKVFHIEKTWYDSRSWEF